MAVAVAAARLITLLRELEEDKNKMDLLVALKDNNILLLLLLLYYCTTVDIGSSIVGVTLELELKVL
jgi:hypothetical protein